MSFPIKVEWTISCSASPAVIRPCARCGGASPFMSTGKFRLNANGNKLDAWLIYSCQTCHKTWNRPVFERRPVGSVSKSELEALQSNNSDHARRIAREPLKGGISCAPPEGDFTLLARPGRACGETSDSTLIVIRNPDKARVRLDKVLACGLGKNRKDVLRLAEAGLLRIQDASARALRRTVPDVVTVEVSLAAGQDVTFFTTGQLD